MNNCTPKAFLLQKNCMNNLRVYKSTDLAQVIHLQREPLIAIQAWKGEGPWDSDLDAIDTIYDGSTGELLVYEIEGEIVAMGAYCFVEKYVAEIRRMRVSTQFQGKGLATKIYAELEKRARQKGAQKLILDTGEAQMAARNLYQKLGFIEVAHKELWGMQCIVFEKLLYK
jgi:GNAT superfamily N-acetyltransferase